MMAQRSTPDGWRSSAEATSDVRVTVVPGPRGHPLRDRAAAIRITHGLPVLVASIVLVLAAGAVVAVALRTRGAVRPAAGGAGGAKTAANVASIRATPATIAGLARIENAYRYPLGCLGLTVSADQSSMLGRQSPCVHYGVYVTAVLRRAGGMWRLMLEATSPKCPAVALPSVVRSALITCKRAPRPPRTVDRSRGAGLRRSGPVARLVRGNLGDQPRAAAVGYEAESPPGKHEDAVLESDEVPEMNHHPGDPCDEPA